MSQRLESSAMRFSWLLGFVALALKWVTFLTTYSAAVFSDALESVVHVLAVSFAFYSLHFSRIPPDHNHHFGHDKIGFLSSAIEGTLIVIAGIGGIVSGIWKIYEGSLPENIETGMMLVIGIGFMNGALALYLRRVARATGSLIVGSNAAHLLSDFWTSLGVGLGLLLAKLSGWILADPLLAIGSSLYICVVGARLVQHAVLGLTDASHPELEAKAAAALQEFCFARKLDFHRLRLRQSPTKVFIDFHLHFPGDLRLSEAHDIGTEAERAVANKIGVAADIMSHIEVETQQDQEQGTFQGK